MDLDKIRKIFFAIENEHFIIINCYIKGDLKKSQIDRFEKALFGFREVLNNFQTNDENIFEIAKMKSRIQHFNTDTLEDEGVLRVAYSNEN